jgi:hypothetical protein
VRESAMGLSGEQVVIGRRADRLGRQLRGKIRADVDERKNGASHIHSRRPLTEVSPSTPLPSDTYLHSLRRP